jgi:hypothetical protein
VLDADPLADIRNTTRIDSVLVRGRLITAEERRRMLAQVAAAAQAPSTMASSATRLLPGCGCHGLRVGRLPAHRP